MDAKSEEQATNGNHSRILPARESANVLRRSLRAILFWKYVVLFILFLCAIFFTTYDRGSKTIDLSAVKSELVSGVVASILIALIYDLFTKKQEELGLNLDRHTLIDEMSREVFLARGVSTLSASDILELTRALLEEDRFLMALANITASRTGEKFAYNIVHSYFRPLWRSPLVRITNWSNKLLLDPSRKDGYLQRTLQCLEVLTPFPKFRIVLTDNAVLGAKLLNSSLFINHLTVLAEHDKQFINDNLSDSIKLRIERRRPDGRRGTNFLEPKMIELTDDLVDLKDVTQTEDLNMSVTIVEFDLPDDIVSCKLEFLLLVPLNLSEPFFYVQAENICFLDTISIDYRDISDRIGKVWATSFVGNATCELEHNRAEAVVVIKVDGVIMPGHGVCLTWANLKSESVTHQSLPQVHGMRLD